MTAENTEAISSLLAISTPTALVALKWTDRGETSLSAIKGFKNLKALDLAGNRLTAGVPELKTLKYLNKLSLARNGIGQLWELPPQLEHLNLAYNQITELSLHLARLKSLDVSNNRLRSLQGILNLPSLTSLYASSNVLTDVLEIERLPHLIEVDFSSNQLSRESACVLFSLASLSAINLRGNPDLHDFCPAEEWLQDEDSLFYRNPNRLKDLKTSRFRREIKRKQESFEIAQESFSLSPSKRNGSYDESNSSTRMFRRDAFILRKCAALTFQARPEESEEHELESCLRRKSIETLFEEVITYCKIAVDTEKGTLDKYERAAQILKDREDERMELIAATKELQEEIATSREQRECHREDLEAAVRRLEACYEEQIRDMNRCLGELQMKQSIESKESSLFLDIQDTPSSAPLDTYPRFHGESLSDSKRYTDDTSCEKPFSRRLDNGKMLVSKPLGKYIERLKASNVKLREKLERVKAQRDRNADAIKRYEEAVRQMAAGN